MLTTALNVMLNQPGRSSIAAGIQNKIVENYNNSGWCQKFSYFISALAAGKSVSAYLRDMAGNDLQAFTENIGLIRQALGKEDNAYLLRLSDGSDFCIEFGSARADENESLLVEGEVEPDAFVSIKNHQRDSWTTFNISKSKLIELIDIEISDHPNTYAAKPELVAACKLERLYQKAAFQFSERDETGKFKDATEIMDHLLDPSNHLFYTNISEIHKNLIGSAAYSNNSNFNIGTNQKVHQTRLKSAVSTFITRQIDLLVYGGVTSSNINSVLTALEMISDNEEIINSVDPKLATKINLLQQHFGQKNLARLPVQANQMSLLDSIVNQAAHEGLTNKNSGKYNVAQILLMERTIEVVINEGLTGSNREDFDLVRVSVNAFPDNATTRPLKALLAKCLQKIARSQPPESRNYHPIREISNTVQE